jgi:hypothetical protein
MIFAVAFLGALFAILTSLLLVYSYVTLRVIPRVKKGVRGFIEEIGPRALFERSGVDPAQVMQELGIDVLHPSRRASGEIAAVAPPASNALRVVFTCEDHGRCPGCPKVLAQFEAIVQHQGAESFDEVERRCYAQLREQLLADEQLDGESEGDRQRRLAARVVEALVREGYSIGIARGVAWGCGKEERATYAGWLSVAREGCQKMSIVLADNKEAV